MDEEALSFARASSTIGGNVTIRSFTANMPTHAFPTNRIVAVLVYDGLCAFEFGCVAEVFGLPRPEFGDRWYRFRTCAASSKLLRGQYGLRIAPDAGLDRLASAGTVVVPGWRSADAPVPTAIIEALRRAHANGARLLSICSGAFVLAATGLLDGKRIATHWRYADRMRARFPHIECDSNVLFCEQGRILTSAGSAAGLDACLHVVRCDYGAAVANQVAKRLVIAARREGGQAQFVEPQQPRRERHSLSKLLDRILPRIGEEWPMHALAKTAAMSERTFLRRFKETTGTTPARWIAAARVDRARELLEHSGLSIDAIAEDCGFGSALNMRRHFKDRLGVAPDAYRRNFSTSAMRIGNGTPHRQRKTTRT
jgi:AraC family transcriptional regulator, transcriptional activator FtrA